MKFRYLSFLPVLAIVFCFNAFGQSNVLKLRTGNFELPNNIDQVIQDFDAKTLLTSNDYYFRIIQFEDVPNKNESNAMAVNGIELLDYLPEKAYYVAIKSNAPLNVLKNYQVRSMVEINADFKLTKKFKERNVPKMGTKNRE